MKLENNQEQHIQMVERRKKKMVVTIILVTLAALLLGFGVWCIFALNCKDEPELIDVVPIQDWAKHWEDNESLRERYLKAVNKLGEPDEPEEVSLEDIPEEEEELDFIEDMFDQAIEEEKDISRAEYYVPEEVPMEYPILPILLDEELQYFTQFMAREYDVPYLLVLALMDTESSFRKDIGESNKGPYYGYMQLSKSNCNNAEKEGIDPYTPRGNIEWGIRYLSELLDCRNSDIPKAIADYKGTSNVESESVQKVMRKYDYYIEFAAKEMENKD